MNEITLFETEHIEYITPACGLVVSPAHTFGTDAFLLADFAAPKRNTVACDLGTGCGIIPMLWACRGLCERIDGVELQPAAVEQFARSIRANAFSARVRPVLADICTLPYQTAAEQYDLVTVNPPYKAAKAGLESTADSARLARHETACTLADIVRTASYLLRYGGRFCMCIRPERLSESIQLMGRAALEPKRLRLVAKTADSVPWLCLLEGKKGGKYGLRIAPTLAVYENGQESAELRRIYGAYKEGATKR